MPARKPFVLEMQPPELPDQWFVMDRFVHQDDAELRKVRLEKDPSNVAKLRIREETCR